MSHDEVVWAHPPHHKMLERIAWVYLQTVLEQGDAAAAEYARRFIDPHYARKIGRIVRALENANAPTT